MRRLLISVAVVAVALLAQVTFVNRLVLPGGAGPDLVLLAVIALALTGGPLAGTLTGFAAGLALDVAPPASHTIGQYALVFCLVGYGCGRLAALGEASPVRYVGISAAAAAVGAALHAVLGVMLSDPEVTWAAVRHVLPPSLIYDVILSPFVLYAVVRLNGWAARPAPGEHAAAASAPASWTAGVTAGAVRQASTSGSPRLHLADHRGSNAWIGSARTADGSHLASPASLRPGTREPKLRFRGLRGAGAGPTLGGRSNGAAGARYAGSRSVPKMNFSGGRPGGGAGARYTGSKSAPKMNFSGGRPSGGAGARYTGSKAAPKMNFSGGRPSGGAGARYTGSKSAPKMNFSGGRPGGGAGARYTGSKAAPKMNFSSAGRRDGLAGRGSGPTSRTGAVPRFRKRSSTGTIGTGGSLGRATPRRGTFGRGRSFGRRRSFGAGSLGGRSFGGRTSGGRSSAPRLGMGRGKFRARIRGFLGRGGGGYR
jgi:rod shape-determining protein MreD